MSQFAHDPLIVTALLFGPLLTGVAVMQTTEPCARYWHTRLHKSPYRPPNFVFPLAWVWSYLTMGYASYVVMDRVPASWARSFVAGLYLLHLVLLNAWPVCFFAVRRIDYGLDVMVALDVLLAVLLVAVFTLEPFAAVLCLPYFCWLLELTYLNMYMYRNNVLTDVRAMGETKEQVQANYNAPVVREQQEKDE